MSDPQDSYRPSPSRISAFVGENTEYYSPIWESFSDPNSSRISFNFAAALLSTVWLLYRKLYVPFTTIILVMIMEAGVSSYLLAYDLLSAEAAVYWDLVVFILYIVVVGAWGNYWYFRKFQRLDEESREIGADPATQEEYLERKGGTSLILPLAFVVLTLALLIPLVQGV